MEICDQHIFFKTPGKQLSFILLMAVWAIALFVLSATLPLQEVIGLAAKWFLATLSLFLAVYFLGYSLILTRRLIERYYR